MFEWHLSKITSFIQNIYFIFNNFSQILGSQYRKLLCLFSFFMSELHYWTNMKNPWCLWKKGTCLDMSNVCVHVNFQKSRLPTFPTKCIYFDLSYLFVETTMEEDFHHMQGGAGDIGNPALPFDPQSNNSYYYNGGKTLTKIKIKWMRLYCPSSQSQLQENDVNVLYMKHN